MSTLTYCFLFLLVLPRVHPWDNEDMEIYDAVEEVNQNFYEFLGVEYDASSSDIRRAYRRLSVKLHPDKNKEEGAEEKFRKMVTAYEILKDDRKRQKYNHVLEHGLPDWRQPVYYFRKARKITLSELFVLLFVIGAVGQYLVLWAMFFEKQLSLEDFFSTKRRRSTRKQRDGYNPDEQLQSELAALPRPMFSQLYPWRLSCWLCHTVVCSPSYIRDLRDYIRKRREMKKIEEEEESEEEEIECVRKPKRRQKINVPEYTDEDFASPVCYTQTLEHDMMPQSANVKHGNWTDDELGLLAKGVAKFQGGTSGRWQKVAEFVGRSVEEVIEKSQELRPTGAANVNPAAQGTTGFNANPVSMKKGKMICDDIISHNEADYVGGQNIMPRPSASLPDVKTSSTPDVCPTKLPGNELKASKIPVAKIKPREGARKTVSANQKLDQKVDEQVTGEVKESCQDASDGAVLLPSDNWTQNQQKILEWALKQIPKTCPDRWEQIASHIPGKSKEECVQRFKHLADMLKQRRQQKIIEPS